MRELLMSGEMRKISMMLRKLNFHWARSKNHKLENNHEMDRKIEKLFDNRKNIGTT